MLPYCRVGWYDDADDLVLVIEHGSPITTADLIEEKRKRVRSIRSVEHAVLSYNSTTGLLKIGGVAKARRTDLAELFADKVLGKPEFFAGDDAQNLYTLDPVQRAGFVFTFIPQQPCKLLVKLAEAVGTRKGYLTPQEIEAENSGRGAADLVRELRDLLQDHEKKLIKTRRSPTGYFLALAPEEFELRP